MSHSGANNRGRGGRGGGGGDGCFKCGQPGHMSRDCPQGGGGGERGGRGGFRGGDRGGRGGGRGGGGGDGCFKCGQPGHMSRDCPQGGGGGERGGRGGFRGGDRGGRGGRGGGRGGGGPGLNRAAMDREKESIDFQLKDKSLYSSKITVPSNFFQLDLSKAHFFEYIFEYKEDNKVFGEPGMEIEIQRSVVSKQLKNTEHAHLLNQLVFSGSTLLSPTPLPDSFVGMTYDYSYKNQDKVEKKVEVTVNPGSEVKAALPAHQTQLNAILGEGVLLEYGTRDGQRFVDGASSKDRGNSVSTMDAVVVKLFRVGTKDGEKDVLQLDVAYTLTSTLTLKESLQQCRSPSELVGTNVVTNLPGKHGMKNIILRFSSIAREKAGDPAGLKKNPDMTFVQYFKEKYNIDLDPKGPVVKTKIPRTIGRSTMYPAEVLRSLALNDTQKRSAVLLCSIYPHDRRELTLKSLDRLKNSAAVKEFLDRYGISFGSLKQIELTGSLLKAPTIYVPKKDGSYTSLDPHKREYCNQAGFTKGLQDLYHTKSASFHASNFGVDRMNNHRDVIDLLKKYHVGIPAAKEMDLFKGKIPESSFVLMKGRSTDSREYNQNKEHFCKSGSVSQIVVKPMEKSIPHMVAQQIAAKVGQLNWVIDPTEVAPKLAKKGAPLVLIGADIANIVERKEKAASTQTLLITFVAFLVEHKQWTPYCSHLRVPGNTFNKGSSSGVRETPADVLNKKFDVFMSELVGEFDLRNKKPGTLIVYRGSATQQDVLATRAISNSLKEALPQWAYAVLSAQQRSNARFAWKRNDHYVNAPRGLCVTEGWNTVFSEVAPKSGEQKRFFYLTSSFCELGNSANTCYVVTAQSDNLPSEELHALTFALCFMYPNKADALPAPLPIKAAVEYARKFAPLSQSKTLPKSMHQSMHYL